MAGSRTWRSSAGGVVVCGGSPLRAEAEVRASLAGSGRGGQGVGVGQDEAAGALGAAQRDGLPQEPTLLNPRWAMSYLRGPMTQAEIRRVRAA